MNYTTRYRAAFANVGHPLTARSGSSASAIEKAEAQLGVRLPQSLRQFYLVAGNEQRINRFHDRLLKPTDWAVEKGRLVFMEENQNVVCWGTPADEKSTADGPVYQSQCDEIRWLREADSCATFLEVMVYWHASGGGAARHVSSCEVASRKARALLDKQWNFVGEVNAMRTYSRPGKGICLVKWTDFLDPTRKPVPYRVFAVGATKSELEQIEAEIPGDWEAWG